MTKEELKSYIDSDIYCRCPLELLESLTDTEAYLDMHYPEDGDEDGIEVMEYYLVSNHLGEKLAHLKEPTMVLSTCFLWGRTCSGIAFTDDPTLQKAYRIRKLLK
jgi:hypothetical protein